MLRTTASRVGAALNSAALACIGMALIKRNQAEVEGAYFNRSVEGGSGDAFLVSTTDLTPWLIAAAALLLLGTATLLLDGKRRGLP